MSEQENIEQQNVPESEKSGKTKIKWNGIFSGRFLLEKFILDQRYYILLLFVLSLVYMSNRYHAEKVIQYNRQLQIELMEKKAEYVTKSSRLMQLSKRSQLLKQIERRGIDLKESEKPPKRIKK